MKSPFPKSGHSSSLWRTLIVAASALWMAAPSPAAPLPLLHASGGQIVDGQGRPVVLHGFNLGGWLVEEPWMQSFVTSPPAGSSYAPVRDHVSLWNTIRQRLGPAAALRVKNAFRDAWIGESDFDRLKQAGANCVRIPFLASLADEPDGLQRLDQAIAWASARGIYVILDLHGAPGGQSDQAHTGQAGVDQFFKSPDDIAAAAQLWTRLARRYRNNPNVAGYDLLNEPTGAPNSDTLYVVTDRLYRAVREGDPGHMIFIEDGYTGIRWMPYPEPCHWENVVYSEHYYHFNAKSDADQHAAITSFLGDVVTERGKRNIPYYIGEFGLEPGGSLDTLSYFLQTCQADSIASTMWTYKVAWKHGKSLWSLYYNASPLQPLDPYNDSEADLIRKCAQFRTGNLTQYDGMAAAFGAVSH